MADKDYILKEKKIIAKMPQTEKDNNLCWNMKGYDIYEQKGIQRAKGIFRKMHLGSSTWICNGSFCNKIALNSQKQTSIT